MTPTISDERLQSVVVPDVVYQEVWPDMTATDHDPVALEHFELTSEPVPAEVLGGESFEVWALRIRGGSVRDVLTTDPAEVTTREYVFAVPLDVMGNLGRTLTELYERRCSSTP